MKIRTLTTLLLLPAALSLQAQEKMCFDFGTDAAAEGWTAVTPSTLFQDGADFGLKQGVAYEAVARKKGEAPLNDYITAQEQIKFTVRLPEGNYKVTVTLGDTEGTSETTVKAEERRLMLENVTTAKKEVVTKSFTVNIRTPKLSPGNAMKLDVREWDPDTDKPVTATWDDALTVSFTGAHPCVSSVVIEPVTDVVTVFLIGDSTVTDQVSDPYGTWGQHLTRFFTPQVAVANHAESGQTAKGFRFQRRWDKVTDQLREGDYVFIQFGHNDLNLNGHDAMWETDDHAGDWVSTYSDAETDFPWMLASFALEVQRRGGIPVIVTPMTKMNMQTGAVNQEGMKGYPDGAREAARLAKCALIDLNKMSVELGEALGADAPKAYVDGLHSNTYGGYLFARCVVEGIKAELPALAAFLTEDAGSFDPSQPSPKPDAFNIPVDPRVQVPTPPGMRMMFGPQNRPAR